MTEKCNYCNWNRQDWLIYKSSFYPKGTEFSLACYDNHPLHYHAPLSGIDELEMKQLVINEIKTHHPELKVNIYDIKVY